MVSSENDFIVAIELGSSRISAIAGKKKDGTMQVLAYAEEETAACVRRGVVYNIEKTYQSVNSVVAKLENVLKTRINKAYVGVAGQSVRSYRCIIKRNMLTQSYITNEAIESIRKESYEIPYADYEVLENFPQEYVVDQNSVPEPVGVMGTNIEGEFLDVIAKTKLRNNLQTVFGNTGIEIAGELVAPLELANNVLNDSEKRSGCALVDIGAETTTVVVYKNNIVRYLVTIPLGMNNVNKDLATIQLEDGEAEDVKLKYGDMNTAANGEKPEEAQVYVTSDGRTLDVSLIKTIINARVTEIVENVHDQIIKSNYSEKLLAGVVLTGGGANMKGIEGAFMKSLNVEKCRIARTVSQPIVKTSNAGSFAPDAPQTNTVVSLLLAGTEPCGGGEYDRSNLFETHRHDEEMAQRQQQQKAEAEEEKSAAEAFDKVKAEIRDGIQKVKAASEELKTAAANKRVRENAEAVCLSALSVLGERYEQAYGALDGKDKFKPSLKEGADLAELLRTSVGELQVAVEVANKDYSIWGRVKRTINDIVAE